MYNVEMYARVRRACMVEGMSVREASRVFGLHRDTVRKMLAYSVPPGYRRQDPPRRPRLEPFTGVIDAILEADRQVPRKQRHTAKRIFERLRDFHRHARTLGLPEFPPALTASSLLSFLAAPIRHQDEHLGTIYLDEKEREYTQEDEETLVLFASQAALVIANARRYREEQRARNDLETLISISPVGVAVFDARTGAPVSFNQEAARIVDSLRDPDQYGGGW